MKKSEFLKPVVSFTALFILASCGGGGGSSSTSSAPVASLEIGAGDDSAPAESVATDVLQRNAARNAATALSVNLAGVQGIGSSSNALAAAALTIDTTGVFNDDVGEEPLDIIPLEVDDLDTDSERLLMATLGLDESGRATAVREGNRITIDPDDQAVCEGETFVLDEAETAALNECLALVSDLTVQLDAVTEQSGQVSYLYAGAPLLTIGYGPSDGMYEVNLATLMQLENAVADLSGIPTENISMSGRVRAVMSVENAGEGTESGTFTIAVPEAVSIQARNGSSMSVAASNIVTVHGNSADDSASIDLGMGALSLLMADEESQGGENVTVNLAGLTGQIAITDNGDRLEVNNLSFGGAPVRVSTPDGGRAELALSPLSFSLAESTGEFLLNTALNFGLQLSMNDPDLGATSASLKLTAPAATRIRDADAPADMVAGGGPLNVSYSMSASGQSVNGLTSIAPGSCQDSLSQDPDQFLHHLFACNPE